MNLHIWTSFQSSNSIAFRITTHNLDVYGQAFLWNMSSSNLLWEFLRLCISRFVLPSFLLPVDFPAECKSVRLEFYIRHTITLRWTWFSHRTVTSVGVFHFFNEQQQYNINLYFQTWLKLERKHVSLLLKSGRKRRNERKEGKHG